MKIEVTKKISRLIDEANNLKVINKLRNLIHYLMKGTDEEDYDNYITASELLALKGLGSAAIAKRLTSERVITPSYYKYKNVDTRFERFNRRGDGWEYKWCYTTVRTILKDMVYVGDMENRKYEVQNYKTKKRIRVPADKHIIVPNTHEGIITRTDY